MKNKTLMIIILIVLSLGLITCGKKNEKDTSYPQYLAEALDKAGSVSVDYQIKTIKDAIDSYYTNNGEYPDNLDALVPAYLQVKTELIDPWGSIFKIENNNIVSAGKDKRFGTADDRQWKI